MRTEADEAGKGGLFTVKYPCPTHYTYKKREARHYRRAVDVVEVLALTLGVLCFSLYFFALMRCLCQATFFVLFIVTFSFLLSLLY